MAIFDKSNEARIGEASTVGQSKALQTRAHCERAYAPIVDMFGDIGQVQSSNEVLVTKEGSIEAQGLANATMVPPVSASWAMPQQIHSIPSPTMRYKHAVE